MILALIFSFLKIKKEKRKKKEKEKKGGKRGKEKGPSEKKTSLEKFSKIIVRCWEHNFLIETSGTTPIVDFLVPGPILHTNFVWEIDQSRPIFDSKKFAIFSCHCEKDTQKRIETNFHEVKKFFEFKKLKYHLQNPDSVGGKIWKNFIDKWYKDIM